MTARLRGSSSSHLIIMGSNRAGLADGLGASPHHDECDDGDQANGDEIREVDANHLGNPIEKVDYEKSIYTPDCWIRSIHKSSGFVRLYSQPVRWTLWDFRSVKGTGLVSRAAGSPEK